MNNVRTLQPADKPPQQHPVQAAPYGVSHFVQFQRVLRNTHSLLALPGGSHG